MEASQTVEYIGLIDSIEFLDNFNTFEYEDGNCGQKRTFYTTINESNFNSIKTLSNYNFIAKLTNETNKVFIEKNLNLYLTFKELIESIDITSKDKKELRLEVYTDEDTFYSTLFCLRKIYNSLQ